MRVAMFTETYLPNTDGVVTSIETTKANLEARGHEVAVFAPGEEERIEGDVHYVKAKRFSAYPEYRLPIYRSDVDEVVADFDPDVIHSHGTFFMGVRAVLAARQQEVPLVYTYHTNIQQAKHYVKFDLPDKAFQKLVWTGLRWYLRRADLVIAPSHATAELLVDRSRGDIERLLVIPTGIDTDRFHPGADAAIADDLPEGPRVLTVGRVAKEKAVDDVVRVASRRPDLTFVVAGDGPYLDEVRDLADRLDADNVVFPGYVPDDELPGLYAACDVFLTASNFETQGLTVLEAMASGLPVVAPDVPVFRETIDHGSNGLLVDDGIAGYAEAVDDAIDLTGADKAARSTASSYDERVCTEKLERAYRAVLEHREPAQNL